MAAKLNFTSKVRAGMVAERVSAAPGVRDYGLLSATAQMYGPVASLFTLPPGAFSPPPEVYSSVIRVEFRPRFDEPKKLCPLSAPQAP